MRTRANDYSVTPEDAAHKEVMQMYKKLLNMIRKQDNMIRKRDNKGMNRLSTMVNVNQVIKLSLKYIQLVITFLDLQKTPHKDLERFEVFLRVFLLKKKSFQKAFDSHYWLVNIDDKEDYIEQFNLLMSQCDTGNRLINNYFNKKYAPVLLKSNQDIYRQILSFLF